MKIQNNECAEICAKCNGQCCRHYACHTHPTDVFGENEPTIERLIEFLSSGNYQVDWWEGDVYYDSSAPESEADDFEERYRSYFIRPAHKNSIEDLFDPAWNGVCVFFEDGNGCKLSFEERPLGGKALVPAADFNCQTSFSKKDSCYEWYKFNKLFDKLEEEYYFEYSDGKRIFTKKANAS